MNVEEMKRKLEAEVRPLWKKAGDRNTPEVKKALKKLGFEFYQLGTSKAQYTCSGFVRVHEVSDQNTYCPAGRYLVWGACNYSRRGYPLYRGYAVKVS